MKKLAPIVMFVYNRPYHTQLTLEALKNNDLAIESELYIFSDAPKTSKDHENVKKVRNIIRNVTGFKQVFISEKEYNCGLANSVINGVSEIIMKYGKVIVLEDDLLTSKDFLKYMNDALEFYRDVEKIWSISAYNIPIKIPSDYEDDIYLSYRASSWGWGTWIDRWSNVCWEESQNKKLLKRVGVVKKFNRGGNDLSKMLLSQLDGEIDSWAVRWCFHQSLQQSYTVYPCVSKVINIGFDGSGTHCEETDKYNSDNLSEKTITFNKDIKINHRITRRFYRFYSANIFQKINNKIKYLINKFKSK